MNTRLTRLLALSSAIGGFICLDAQAVTIDFSNDGDFANNFHAYPVTSGESTAIFAQSASSGNLTLTTNSAQTASFIYDTNGSASGSTHLLPGVGGSVVVEFDFSTNNNNAGIGVFFGGARTGEHLALFNINNTGTPATNDQLRIFNTSNWNATTPSVVGNTSNTAFSEIITNGGWTVNTTYHATFTMTYTSANTVDVTYVITDPSNNLVTLTASATGLSVSSTSNEIGFRVGSSATGASTTITMDNISITSSVIPEPSMAALLGGLGALGIATLRRRRR